MADVVDFPNGNRARHRWEAIAELDEQYVEEVLRASLPADALARIAGRDHQLAVRKAIRRLDEVRVGRALDPGYDRSQSHGVVDALREMVGPGFDPDAPDCA